MKKTILITGIHGVGKQFTTDKLIGKVNIPIYSASKIIRMNNYKSDDNKRVDDIEKNQEILINNINEYIEDDLIILDSHTCLLDSNSKIVRVKPTSLDKLNIQGIIFIYDEIDKIKERLINRDNINFTVDFLKEFQEAERKSCHNLALKYNIPIIEFKNNSDINNLIDFVLQIEAKSV